MKDATRDAIALRRSLSARLRPLALAIGVLISLGLPITYCVLELEALRRGAESGAAQLAARLPGADPAGIVNDFVTRTGAAAVRILDARQDVLPAVDVITPSVQRWWNWVLPVGTAPVLVQGETVGRVEVSLSQGPVVATTAGLFLLSTMTGVGLALLVYFVPVGGVGGMERRLTELITGQESLITAGRVLAGSLDLRDVLDRFTETAVSLPGIDVVRIWLSDPLTGVQTLATQSGAVRTDFMATRVLGRGEGLSGAVMEARRPMVITDVPRDPRLVNRPWYEAEGFVSFLGVPLIVGDVVLGALSCVSRTRRDWSASEITLAEAVASLAAVAIRNATNFGEMTRRGDRLHSTADLARAVSGSLELTAVLRHVVAAVAALRRHIFCVVRLVDHAAGGYRVAGTGGAYEEAVQPVLRFGEGLTHLVAESGRPLLVSEAGEDGRTRGVAPDALRDFPIYYGVPIQSGGTLLGVLSASFPSGAPPTADERETIELYAGQAAVAIQNARLFEQSERRRRAAELLARIGRELSQALDPAILAERIQTGVRELFHTRAAGIYRYDAATGALVALGLSGDAGPTSGLPAVFPRGTGAAGLAVQERRAVATPNVLTDPRVTLDDVARTRIEASGYRSVLATPLVVKDTVVGALAVGDVEGRVFTEEEAQLLQTFADQATLALENARLYSEAMRREREAGELARVARELSATLDVGDVGARIAESVLPLFEARSSGLYTLEPDGSFRGVAWGGEARAHYTPGQRFPAVDGVIGWVAANNAPVANPDVLADPQFVFPEPRRSELAAGGNRAVLAVPLRAKGTLIGVLAVADKPGRTFSHAEIALLQAFADQAALALENARLYQRAQQAYAELAEAQDRLVRGETMRAMGELASGVAHHLNNLLAIILGRVQLSLAKTLTPDVARHLGIAERAILDGAEVIRRMRGFSLGQPEPDLAEVELNRLVEEIIELTRPRWEDEAHVHGVTIETRLESSAIPPVQGEVGPLREVLMNLVLNAVDAMPEGGRITLRTWADDAWVHCSVSDTGVGMTPEVRRRALEPFFTTKGVRSTGLGLSMNYGIVQRLGGELTIDSVEGRGTTITFTLPVAHRTAPPPATPPAAAPRALRVLVIDDEEEVRALLGEMLAADGHDVVEAASGVEGLGCLDGQRGIDVVLSDLGMPGMTGWEVARAVKARHPELPVVLVTGWGEDPVGRPEDRKAVDVIIAKPVTSVSLRAALARAAASG